MKAPNRAAELLETAVAHHKAGNTERADAIYQQILRIDGDNHQALYLRSLIAMGNQQYERTVELLEHAIRCSGPNAVYLTNLGEAHRRLGKSQQAVAALRAALEINRDLAEIHYNLGLALHEQKALGDAIDCYENALRLKPALNVAEEWLIRALCEAGLLDRALERYRVRSSALAMSADLHGAIARALADTWRAGWFSGRVDARMASRLDEAIDQFRRALELAPERADLHRGFANALHDRGDIDDAISHYRTALALAPNDTVSHSNLAFLIGFHPASDDEAICNEARSFARQHTARFAAQTCPHPNTREPDRRLRIGYVSPNFREGCQALYFVPMVRAHDRRAFEIFAYSLAESRDSITDSITGHCDAFRDVHRLNNARLAEQIRSDAIDILVDLTMHMGQNRALMFARKPAPVQICWLAYPGTTGLDAMDYRVTDPYLDPPALAEHYVEKSLRLPETFWCYDPLTSKPAVAPPPVATAGHITFGCLNTFRKTNVQTLELWAPVMREVEGSRLLLLAPDGVARNRVRAVLSEHGVDPSRVSFVGHQPRGEYLETYQRIDLCLDPWPVQGHTTSLDALWMGVPVVSLIGPTVLGRAASSFAVNIGLRELVSSTPEKFGKVAIELARDLSRLAELRGALRTRLERSPLMDAPRFTRNLEAAFRQAWREWCFADS